MDVQPFSFLFLDTSDDGSSRLLAYGYRECPGNYVVQKKDKGWMVLITLPCFRVVSDCRMIRDLADAKVFTAARD